VTATLDLTVDDTLAAQAQAELDKLKRPTIAQFTATGISYRRLDYWTHCGYLRADDASPGSGCHRTWGPMEVTIAALMVRLTEAGLTAEAAARVARHSAQQPHGVPYELATGVWVDVHPEELAA
jgi:hypothetical protein